MRRVRGQGDARQTSEGVRGQEDAPQTSEGLRGLAEKGILVSFEVKNFLENLQNLMY